MELFILRHAVAEKRGQSRYKQDGRRPLTPKGAKKMRKNAKGMKAAGFSFGRILSSPYLRARQTAEIVADVFHQEKKKIYLTKNLLPGKPLDSLLAEIRFLSQRSGGLLLVGHEPHLSDLISYLLIGEAIIPMTLEKGGLCQLAIPDGSVAPHSGFLQGFWSPGVLRLLR